MSVSESTRRKQSCKSSRSDLASEEEFDTYRYDVCNDCARVKAAANKPTPGRLEVWFQREDEMTTVKQRWGKSAPGKRAVSRALGCPSTDML